MHTSLDNPTLSQNLPAARQLLNTPGNLPLTLESMAKSLKVTFCPPHEPSAVTASFCQQLQQHFIDLGAKVIPFEEALDQLTGKISPGIVVVEQGIADNNGMAMYRLASLYQNPLVSVYHKPCPVDSTDHPQQQLDKIVSVLAWNLTYVPIFLEDDQWTICTMNGAVVPCGSYTDMREQVLSTLVPKLAAHIIPPSKAGVIHQNGRFNPTEDEVSQYHDDFVRAGLVWEQNGLMLAHTSLESLTYRDKKNKRFVETFLDNRTGMSYGFMAWQLPAAIVPAEKQVSSNGLAKAMSGPANGTGLAPTQVTISWEGEQWLVDVPKVSVLTTRSGCKKTTIDPAMDIVRMTWNKGVVVFDSPEGIAQHCRPSYDTLAILSHALANALVASIILRLHGETPFVKSLLHNGLSISHWHSYVPDALVPDNHMAHGIDNPPVSCATPQSAIYALLGKLMTGFALNAHYAGDVHTEPHHGTIVSSTMSLVETAQWAGRCKNANAAQVTDQCHP